MFENLSHLALQQYWWVIISLLGAVLVFLMFVQGGQTLIYKLGKTEEERNLLVNALGRKWELTFTTLVTFGGAFFASFPLFYSTSFGGAYWVWMAILFAFILQAVSYEYRSKPNNFLGKKAFEGFLFFNGAVGTILIGAAVATFFTGSQFSVDKMNLLNLTGNKMPIISAWETPFHGLEAIWTMEKLAFLQNLSLGLAVFFLARLLGNLFFINYVNHSAIVERAKKSLKPNAILFLAFFLFFVIRLMVIDGFAVVEGVVSLETNKYLHNFLEMPVVLSLFLIGVVLVLFGIYKGVFTNDKKAFWYTSSGTVLAVLSLFLIAGLNGTAFYPSTFNLQSSLTIENSSSSHYTLAAMSYVSILVPFVVAYIWYVWKAMTRKQISLKELEEQDHVY
jgi:cytochrome bd ubiquinol oxidase subunit II